MLKHGRLIFSTKIIVNNNSGISVLGQLSSVLLVSGA